MQPAIRERRQYISCCHRRWKGQCQREVPAEPVHSEAGPARESRLVETELIERAADNMINDLIHALRMIVERRSRRKDDRTHAGKSEHVFQMNFIERALAHEQNELARSFR